MIGEFFVGDGVVVGGGGCYDCFGGCVCDVSECGECGMDVGV